MAMSRSLRENGSDEVREQVSDICCFCAKNNKIQPASYFCFECGNFGRFLCGTCLQNHNLFVGNHDVTHIGSQSNSRFVEKEKKLQKLQGDVKQLLAEKEIMKSQLNKATTDRDDKQHLANTLEKQLEELKSQNAKMAIEEKNETMQKLDGEVKWLMNENKMMKGQLDKAMADRDERQNVVKNLEEMFEKSNSENTELKSQIKQLLTEKAILVDEGTKTGNTIIEVATETAALEENIEKLNKSMEKLNSDKQRKLDDKRREVDTLSNKLSDVVKERYDSDIRKVTYAMQQGLVSSGSDKKEKILAAAIYLGTAFSSYAYSFKHEYHTDPCKCMTLQWVDGSDTHRKVPTVVLFDENKKFHSFGYEAEDTYAELALENKHHNWYIFRRFNMILYDKKIKRNIEIKDIEGKTMKAIDVFGAAINYFKNHLLQFLKKKGTFLENEDIHWVLTVPAVWTGSAKQFMREAAYKADIDDAQLSIALEPEVAILYCQLLPEYQMRRMYDGAKSVEASTGTKYMVIDLCDDTAAITVHERQADGGLRELHKDSVDSLGGNKVDEEFFKLLIRIIGGPLYAKFVDENRENYLDLKREFKKRKIGITPHSNGKITIITPALLPRLYKDEMKENITVAIDDSPYCGKITWRGDKMRIDAQIFKNWFKSCTDRIVSHILGLLKQPDVQGTTIFLMVGEFSESVMVQDALMKALPEGKVIIPADAGLTVLKGAVIFGHRPVAITSRVSRYTYGISISPPFDPNIHPEVRRVAVGGIHRCRDVFMKYIYVGETLRVGEARSWKHVTVKSDQKEMLLKIFASPRRDPMFVDEDDTEYLGKVVVNLPDSEDKIRVEVKMMFGGTELTVEAMELSQRTKYRAYFEFL